MSADIRIKGEKKNIKLLNHVEILEHHLKESSIKTKDATIDEAGNQSGNTNEYGANKIEQTVEVGTYEAAYQVKRQVGNKIHRKEPKQSVHETTNVVPKEASKEAALKQIRERTLSNSEIKTRKNTLHGPKEASQKGIKTAENTKAVIKTSSSISKSTNVKTSAKAIEKSVQATQKATQIAKTTAKTTEKAVVQGGKATAKGTSVAVRTATAALKSLISAMISGGWITVLILIIVLLFAGILAITGGNESSSAMSVSAEVEAYEPIIRKYATQYGIPDYVDLLKAVMMQESGGAGSDPMQAAEGSFNKKYPHTPNGITDPEYSIECGVQELAAALQSAKVESPIDIGHIKLALQGYNFGNGYIAWAVQKDGGYTTANAIEFSDMMAKRMGWSSYGDKEYAPHVLQYYPYSQYNIGMGKGSGAIVASAQSQLNKGGSTYWSWYGYGKRVEWCACFVSWNADQCGYIESGVIPKFSYCPTGADWFKTRNQWQVSGYTPNPGDIIFFDWDGDGITDHVGVVEKVMNGTVYTVEGNSGDMVAARYYTIDSRFIYGYGVPRY